MRSLISFYWDLHIWFVAFQQFLHTGLTRQANTYRAGRKRSSVVHHSYFNTSWCLLLNWAVTLNHMDLSIFLLSSLIQWEFLYNCFMQLCNFNHSYHAFLFPVTLLARAWPKQSSFHWPTTYKIVGVWSSRILCSSLVLNAEFCLFTSACCVLMMMKKTWILKKTRRITLLWKFRKMTRQRYLLSVLYLASKYVIIQLPFSVFCSFC